MMQGIKFANRCASIRLGLSSNLLALLFLAHAFIPKARTHTNKFFHLSYFNPQSGNYAIGADDAYLISFFIVLFTGLRAACMEYMLAPLGRSRGISKRKDLTRFTEQGWLFVYYSVFWTMGAVSSAAKRPNLTTDRLHLVPLLQVPLLAQHA